jgi:hypothetical protein
MPALCAAPGIRLVPAVVASLAISVPACGVPLNIGRSLHELDDLAFVNDGCSLNDSGCQLSAPVVPEPAS